MDELLGIAEVADLSGVSRQAVTNWRLRHNDFPKPVAELQAGPVFRRADIVQWVHDKRGISVNAALAVAAPESPKTHRWWEGRSHETFWLETTDRDDIGVDLKAPQTDDRGLEHHGYALVTMVNEGDVVFHYDTDRREIVGWSRATGSLWEEDIVWASHGTVAREAGVAPYRRAGWKHALDGPYYFEIPVTLEDLRAEEAAIRTVRDGLRRDVGSPIYFPFALSDRRPLRPTQFYMTKFPADLVSLFPPLVEARSLNLVAENAERLPVTWDTQFGSAYRPADEDAATSERDPFTVDPNVVDRGLRAHAWVQNQLAAEIIRRGAVPLTPAPTDPKFDVAWRSGDTTYVAEVKSLTTANEEQQLRMGLGQVIRYRHLLATTGRDIKAILAVERAPSDSSWLDLCAGLDVVLAWPGAWSRLD